MEKKAHISRYRPLQSICGVWEFLKPRKARLAIGLALVALNRLAALVLPATSKFLIDNVITRRQCHFLVPIVLVIVAAALVQGFSSLGLTEVLSKEAEKLITELRARVQSHVITLSVAFYDSTKVGTLVTRIMNDVEGLHILFGGGMVQFISAIMTSIFAFVVLIRISVLMTSIAAGTLFTFGLLLTRGLTAIHPMFWQRRKITADLTGRLTESLGGIRIVKVYLAEDWERNIFRNGLQNLLDNVVKTLTVGSFMSFAATTLLGLETALIMYIGARRILSGHMSLGTFVTYMIFLALLLTPVTQIVGVGTQLSEAMAGLDRTREMLKEHPENCDPQRVRYLRSFCGAVRFANVSFSYNPVRPVLHDLYFEASPDSITALVGPSGSGKSTIVGLVCGFYEPTQGQIFIDNFDLRKVHLESYRQYLGVVLQEPFLFDGTIRENILFSRHDANEREILRACQMAGVDEFAEAFQKGYDTVVGERGVKLSGGQKQRVSIARAFLANPRILILDEATSSLDYESEHKIQESLAHLMSGRTTFVIAHRLSTILRADQILVVEGGRIIERGTHAALYSAGGSYFSLYSRQQQS